MARDFLHRDMNEEIKSVSGEYVLTKEARLRFDGSEILYMTGYGVFDTSCCGSGGCGYAIVPGFVKDWKIKKDETGRHISRIEPIVGTELQQKIRDLIKKNEMVQEVRFE